MDDIYNLALHDLSQALADTEKVLAGDDVFCEETNEHIRELGTVDEVRDELLAVTLAEHPLLYAINNEADEEFVKARNKARKDWQQWHLFVDNYIPKDE